MEQFVMVDWISLFCCATLLREERVDCRHYMKDASETFV